MSRSWDEPGWLERATAWIDEHVDRTGPVELVHARPWSALVRFPSVDGVAWFKENQPASAFEPALTERLEAIRADCLPEVVAWEGPRLVTLDTGTRLRLVHDAGEHKPSWDEILPLYAELQVAFVDVVEEALALRTPDDRPELLAERYAELGGDQREAVQAATERLADSLPLTVAHMEAHDGNVFVRSGDPVFIDWAEAVVTHPFVGPLQALRTAVERAGGEAERFRDLYLEPFTSFAPMDELRELFEAGYLLHGVSRAVLWRRTLQDLTPEAAAEWGDPVGAWLGIIGGIADGTVSLGEA